MGNADNENNIGGRRGKAQNACQVTKQKDPCWRENKQSMKCLDDNNYNKSYCQTEFENYKNCKGFWNNVYWARKREGRYPLMPETEEERNLFKQKYRETGKVPVHVDDL